MFTRAGIVALLGAWGGSASADDLCPATPAAIADTADALTDAFKNMASDALKLQHTQLVEQETCLDAVPSPAQVAQIYRGEALFASFDGRPADAERWLHAMVEADPGAQLPFEVAAEGTKLQNQLRGVRQSPARPRVPAATTQGYTLLLDGVPTSLRSADRPALWLVLDDHGVVWGSGILAVSDAVPKPPPLLYGRHPWPRWLVVTEASTLAVTGGLWAVAAIDRGRVDSTLDKVAATKDIAGLDQKNAYVGMTASQIQSLGATTNALGDAAQGATVLAIGLATVGFAVRW